MKETEEAINGHPGWSVTQDLEAAVTLGLRYGPERKADLVRRIPLKELSEFYGQLAIKSATFVLIGKSPKKPGSSFADLHWYVYANKVGTTRTLLILVEPFFGKVVAINDN